MNRSTQVGVLHRFFELRQHRTTTSAPEPRRQAASAYLDPARAEAERKALFRRRPLLVALGADLPEPGSYYATDCAGVPLLLVRGEDGIVRGLLNVCRHRGSRVACGRGQPGRAFKCPYHAWAYDLNGELLGQPLAKAAFAGLERSELGLLPVPVAERHGVIFAAPEGEDPIDVAAELCGLGPELGEFDFDGFVPYAERSGVFNANWKLLYDTALESYHIFSLHRESLAPSLLSTPLVADFFGPHSRAVVMSRKVSELSERDESEWDLRANASIIYTIFPSALLNFPMSGHVERWEIYPDAASPDRARAAFTFYVPRDRAGETRFWDANLALTERVVFGEDFSQQEEIHGSLRSGLLPELVFGRNEPMLIRQHELLESALAEAPDERGPATVGAGDEQRTLQAAGLPE